MKLPTLTTSKMPGETEQQYTAWILYCDAGSLAKLHRSWEGLQRGFSDPSSESEVLRERLGSAPTVRTLAQWSKKYRWVERRDMKLAQELEVMKEKVAKIKREKTYKIAEIFERALVLLLKKIRSGYQPTIQESKQLWEMVRTELGESISKHEVVAINEAEQVPPTEEEKELGRAIDDAIIEHYRKQAQKRRAENV